MISLITCTGARPEAFKLCCEYMFRQTYDADIVQWIVVEDASSLPITYGITPFNFDIHFFKGPMPWEPGINTQRPNMDEALKHVKGDKILIIEDDDWYAPNYIEVMSHLLDKFEAVGEANNRYYCVKDQAWRQWGNREHASLCSTGLRTTAVRLLFEAIHSGELWPDLPFWRKVRELKKPHALLDGSCLNVGIKQMPGRKGLGSGHDGLKDQRNIFNPDSHLSKLVEWIGEEDASRYREIAKTHGWYLEQ